MPGLSGLAQVNGRNNITIFEKIAYDTYYVEHISLALDIKILLFTVLSVIIVKKGPERFLPHCGDYLSVVFTTL